MPNNRLRLKNCELAPGLPDHSPFSGHHMTSPIVVFWLPLAERSLWHSVDRLKVLVSPSHGYTNLGFCGSAFHDPSQCNYGIWELPI